MHTTIIFAHPWHGSFNKAILDAVTKELELHQKEYSLIDLNKDGFNPAMAESDLALYSRGQSTDRLVQRYQEMLKDTDELIFIFPIWWNNIPAILKGFMDKVMLKDFSYIETPIGLKGKLTHIKRTFLFTTSESPTAYINLLKGNPIRGTFIKGTLKVIGLKKIKWRNHDMTTSGSDKNRQKYLEKVAEQLTDRSYSK